MALKIIVHALCIHVRSGSNVMYTCLCWSCMNRFTTLSTFINTIYTSHHVCEKQFWSLEYPFSKVPNFWPSISRTTGDHLPGRYVCRLAASFTAFPRMMDAVLYYSYFAVRRPMLFEPKQWYMWLNRFNFFLLMIEIFLLYTMIFISSKEHIGM